MGREREDKFVMASEVKEFQTKYRNEPSATANFYKKKAELGSTYSYQAQQKKKQLAKEIQARGRL